MFEYVLRPTAYSQQKHDSAYTRTELTWPPAGELPLVVAAFWVHELDPS